MAEKNTTGGATPSPSRSRSQRSLPSRGGAAAFAKLFVWKHRQLDWRGPQDLAHSRPCGCWDGDAPVGKNQDWSPASYFARKPGDSICFGRGAPFGACPRRDNGAFTKRDYPQKHLELVDKMLANRWKTGLVAFPAPPWNSCPECWNLFWDMLFTMCQQAAIVSWPFWMTASRHRRQCRSERSTEPLQILLWQSLMTMIHLHMHLRGTKNSFETSSQ